MKSERGNSSSDKSLSEDDSSTLSGFLLGDVILKICGNMKDIHDVRYKQRNNINIG